MLYKDMEVFSWSMLAKYMTCHKAYNWRYDKMLTHERKSKAMSFGSTIHDGLATWYKTKDLGATCASMEFIGNELGLLPDSESDPKHSIERARNVMLKYVDRYKDFDFNMTMVEVPFLVEVETETKPFLFAGTIDGIAEVENQEGEKMLYIAEHKTTTRMGSDYIKSFHPNNQITAYSWALSKYLDRVLYGSIINIIHLLTHETNFIRHTTTRAAWELERWEDDLRNIVRDIRAAAERGVYYLNTSQCNVYGSCPYQTLCNTAPQNVERFIEAEYVVDLPGDLRWLFNQEKEHLNVVG